MARAQTKNVATRCGTILLVAGLLGCTGTASSPASVPSGSVTAPDARQEQSRTPSATPSSGRGSTDPSATAWSPPVPAPEVVDKQPHAPAGGKTLAAWTDSTSELTDLWSTFSLSGSPPRIDDGMAILLVASGESGSCPYVLERVDEAPGRVDLTLTRDPNSPEQAVTQLPAGGFEIVCTADFQPITFVVALDSTVVSPPFDVDFGRLVVTVEEPNVVAEAPSS